MTEDRFTGESNFYLYAPAGNVAGITDQDGYLWQSYRYDAFGNATFGSPQYDNEYTFNGESYNPNIHSQYLRARYYDTVKGSFLTEDSYLGDIRNPLTLNRYSYCIGNPLFYSDPSGHWGVDLAALENEMMNTLNERDRRVSDVTDYIYDKTGEILGTHNDSMVDQVVSGFAAGFTGSFYETFDLITHPEIILATVFEAVTHPVETAVGIIKNKYTKGLDVILQYLVEENYRMVGQEAGRMAGEKVQDLIAAAVVAAVLQTCGDGKSDGGTLPKSGLPDVDLPESEGRGSRLKYDLQFFAEKDGELPIEGGRGTYDQNAGNYLAGKAPKQVTPGVRNLEGQYIDDLGRVQPWKAYYDEYGRIIGRTDYNAGNIAQGIPDTHYHTYEWGPGKLPLESGSHIEGEYSHE